MTTATTHRHHCHRRRRHHHRVHEQVERDVYRTRLLQCKGARTVRATEKECTNASLNCGDVFILDMGLQLFVYNGKDANK